MTPEAVKAFTANPTRIVLSEEAFNKAVQISEAPSEPTPALIALMRAHKAKTENGIYERSRA